MKLLHKLPVPFLRIWNHHSDSEKNSLPGYISPEQLIFLKKIRHHRQFVFTARILLLILFLLQWELCANAGIVDSFIFSSPSRIARCFWRNKFSVGEQIEVMKPNGDNIEATVKSIQDEEGNQMESAPHPKQILYIDLGIKLDRYDILRRKEPVTEL